MGYPMAKNLRAGIGSDQTLLICDVNTEALQRFKKDTEGQGPVAIISNGFEAAKAAVRTLGDDLDTGSVQLTLAEHGYYHAP
jgi:hypothetical protein